MEFLPSRFMTCSEAAKQLLDIVDTIKDRNAKPGKLTVGNFGML